jgi:hypothetical protein
MCTCCIRIPQTKTFSPEFDCGVSIAVAVLFFVWALPQLARVRGRKRHRGDSVFERNDKTMSVNTFEDDDGGERQPLLAPPTHRRGVSESEDTNADTAAAAAANVPSEELEAALNRDVSARLPAQPCAAAHPHSCQRAATKREILKSLTHLTAQLFCMVQHHLTSCLAWCSIIKSRRCFAWCNIIKSRRIRIRHTHSRGKTPLSRSSHPHQQNHTLNESLQVHHRQRWTFRLDFALHVAIIVLSSLDAYRMRHSWNDAWFFEAAWSVIQPLFWTVALALRRADRAAGLPARATAQVSTIGWDAQCSTRNHCWPKDFQLMHDQGSANC